MKLELITAEGPATFWMRKGRLIRKLGYKIAFDKLGRPGYNPV